MANYPGSRIRRSRNQMIDVGTADIAVLRLKPGIEKSLSDNGIDTIAKLQLRSLLELFHLTNVAPDHLWIVCRALLNLGIKLPTPDRRSRQWENALSKIENIEEYVRDIKKPFPKTDLRF